MTSKIVRFGRGLGSSAMLLAVAGFAWAAGLHEEEPPERVLAAETTPGGRGSCDVDGVRVAYASQYAPAEHHVEKVTVRDISSSCGGAIVSVVLRGQTDGALMHGTATATVPSGADLVTVELPNGGPLARSIYNVDIEIAGGETPRPQGCTQTRFDFIHVGELDVDDEVIGTNGSDLVYGLSGDDDIIGLNGRDCLVGGDGADTIRGGNHVSFIDGGAGADTITLGNASNKVIGGAGDEIDTIKVGNGDNKITLGTGANKVTLGNGKNTVTVVGGESNTTCRVPRSSKTTPAGLAGCKFIEWTP